MFDKVMFEWLGGFVEWLELEIFYFLEMIWIGNVEFIEGVFGGIVIEDLILDFDLL